MRIPIPKAEAARADFYTKKGLGQHLLRDPTVVEDMLAALAPGPGDAILEIGPGLGALTETLLARSFPLLAVEVDARACEVLRGRFGGLAQFHLEQADVLETDLTTLAAQHLGGAPFHVAANLPYYITTPILARILEGGLPFVRMAVLAQWEVARRLAAGPGSKEYSALSVMAQYRCKVEVVRKVLPGAFTPVPKVDSGLVLFRRLEQPPVKVSDPAAFFKIVRAAFGKRRKMVRNSLRMNEGLALGEARLDAALAEAGIAPDRRPETLGLAEFARLSEALRI